MIENKCPEIRVRNESDVLGPAYRMPDTRAYLTKPREFMISKSKDRDYLAGYMKEKKQMPSPT